MFRTFATAAIFTLGMTAAHAEGVSTDVKDVSTNVWYGDLDLSQPADARILAGRLQEAAMSVCLKANAKNTSSGILRSCVDVSVSMAMSRIEDSLDQAVHAKLLNVRTAMLAP
jgi:UrcA family protein